MNKPSGILLIHKPSGPTSHDIVAQARKILKTREVGHTGTLDPIASGLLILTVGRANKLSQYIMAGKKDYIVTVRLGVETDTLDREGRILSTQEVSVSNEVIQKTIREMTGDLTLRVPAFSAVKLDGKKLYELARKNEEVPVIERIMTFYEAKFLERSGNDISVFLKCFKGAYIRSWVQELGRRLGCGAMVLELKRTFNEPYELLQADFIENLSPESSAWIPFNEILSNWPRVMATEKEQTQIGHGLVSPRIMVQAEKLILGTNIRPKGVFVTAPHSPEIICFLETQKNGQPLKLKKVFI